MLMGHKIARRCCTLGITILMFVPVAFAERVTIYRDDFGVPHVYAQTLAGAAYGVGYAQAEDRLEQLLQNYRLAAGTLAEVAGPAQLQRDYRSRHWQHESICREKFSELDPHLQEACASYIRGVEHFMQRHPERVPAWAQPLEPHFPVMLSRFIIWGWPEGQAADDLQRVGIRPDPVEYRGSNQWLIAPGRTTVGAPIACIDPHLSWYGPFRFYEVRLYAEQEDLAISGASILGVPLPGLGHSQYASIAMTTGGPDTADVYEETLNPENPFEYQFDGQWRPIEVRRETIRVRTGEQVDEQSFEFHYTHHGPVVARRDDKVYTMALPYFDQVGLMAELYNVLTSKSLDEVKQALSTRQLMPQNVMVATVDGDIFYVRTGRVPLRNHGLPTDRPIPGHLSANEYAGIHPFEDLVQITNPDSGYMQNCNISPYHLMVDSPLTPDKYAERPYLYEGTDAPAHQRAEMVKQLLHQHDRFTVEEAIDLAFSTKVLGADRWQQRLSKAWNAAPADRKSGDVAEIYEQIAEWDQHSRPDSIGALVFYYFKLSLDGSAGSEVDVPTDLTDEQLLAALKGTARRMRSQHQRLDLAYGDLFRVGREGGDRTFPVGGGTVRQAGMATPRAISFSRQGDEFVGHSGQTSTQIVVLSKPPRSYMVLPLGESDDPDSPHWDDQAERLFSTGQAKDTYFMDREGLAPHVTETTELDF